MLCLRTGWSSQQGRSCRRVSERQGLAGQGTTLHGAVCVLLHVDSLWALLHSQLKPSR